MGQKSVEIRKLIVLEVKSGVKYRDISKKYEISIAGISKIMKKHQSENTVERKAGSGRNRKTTAHDDRMIHRLVRTDPSKSTRVIAEELNLNVTMRTINNRIHEFGIRSYFKIKKPLLRKQNVKKRLQFAKKYVNKPLSFWKTILWTDESKYELKNTKRRARVYCKPTERLKTKYTQGTVKHGGGSLLVWGCFSWKGVGKIVKIDGIMTGESYVNILKENLVPSVKKIGLGRYVFQQDNDPKHTSKVAKQYFVKKKMKMLEWPPQSPDLNPIEHLWGVLDARIPIESRKNGRDFWEGIQTAWDSISVDILHKLVESMPNRLQEVIASKGGHTSY